jgi:hypothetical protein
MGVGLACMALAVLGRITAQGAGSRPPTRASHQLESVHRDLAQPEAGARQPGGVPLAAGHLVDVVLRRRVPVQFPAFAKEVLHGDEQVASLLLVVFSIGIGIGSLLCEMLSKRHVEIGLVPLGAIGMSVFAIDLYFASRGLPPSERDAVSDFMAGRRTGA